MIRVLLVCGSLQRASANRAALDVARAVLSASGVEVSAFEGLGSIPPLNPDRGDDPGEAVLAFRGQIGAADAVLMAAPEYAGAVAGVVKNALDWIVGSGDLYGKPVALLSAGTTGGVFARRDLVRTLSWQGAHVVASLGIEGAKTRSVSDADGARRFTVHHRGVHHRGVGRVRARVGAVESEHVEVLRRVDGSVATLSHRRVVGGRP